MDLTESQINKPDDAKKESRPANDNTPQPIPVWTALRQDPIHDQDFLQSQLEQEHMEMDSQFSAMDAPRFIPLINVSVRADDNEVFDNIETGPQSSHINSAQLFTVNDLLRDDFDHIHNVRTMEDGPMADELHPAQDDDSPMPRDERAPMVVSSDSNYIPYQPHERPAIVSSSNMDWARDLNLPNIIDIPSTPSIPTMPSQIAPGLIPRYPEPEMFERFDMNNPPLAFTWPSSRGYPKRFGNWPWNPNAFPSRPQPPTPELGGHGDIFMGYTPREDWGQDRIGMASKLFKQNDPNGRRLYEDDMRRRATSGGGTVDPSRLTVDSFGVVSGPDMTPNEMSCFGPGQDWMQNLSIGMPNLPSMSGGMPTGMPTGAAHHSQHNESVPPYDVPMQSIEPQQPSQPAQQSASSTTNFFPVSISRPLGTKTRVASKTEAESSEEENDFNEPTINQGDDDDDDWKPKRSGARKKKAPSIARRAATATASSTAPCGPATSAPERLAASTRAQPSAPASRKKGGVPRKAAAPKNPAAPRNQASRKKAQNKAAAEAQGGASQDNDLGPASSQTVAYSDDLATALFQHAAQNYNPAAAAPQPARPPPKKRAPAKKKAAADIAGAASGNSKPASPESRKKVTRGPRGPYKRKPNKDAAVHAPAEAAPTTQGTPAPEMIAAGRPGAADLMVFTAHAPCPGPKLGPRVPQHGQHSVPSAGQQSGQYRPPITLEEHQRRVPEFAAAVQQHDPPELSLHLPDGRPYHNVPQQGGQRMRQGMNYNPAQHGGQNMHCNIAQQGGQGGMHYNHPQQGGQSMYRNPPQQGSQGMNYNATQQGGQNMHHNFPQQGDQRIPHNPPQRGGQTMYPPQRIGFVNQHIGSPSTNQARQTGLSSSPMGRYPNLSPAHFRAPLPENLERQLYDVWTPEPEYNSSLPFLPGNDMTYRMQAEHESTNGFERFKDAMVRNDVDFDVNHELMRRQRLGHQPGDIGQPLTEAQLRMHNENNRHNRELEERIGNSYPRVNNIPEQTANVNRPPEDWLPTQSRADLQARMLPPAVPASRMQASTAGVEADDDDDADGDDVQDVPTKRKRPTKVVVKAKGKTRQEAVDASVTDHQLGAQEQVIPPVQTPHIAAQASTASVPVIILPAPVLPPKKQAAKRQPAKKRTSAAADLTDEKPKPKRPPRKKKDAAAGTSTAAGTSAAAGALTAAGNLTATGALTAGASLTAADDSTIVVATTALRPSPANLFSGQHSPITNLFPFSGGPYVAASRRAREPTPTPASGFSRTRGGGGVAGGHPVWRQDETWGSFRDQQPVATRSELPGLMLSSSSSGEE
ncbi:hypothetical protein B0T18DRAFT_392773 [Schizothecium vesticola]|uniref:Uncharacterized protein n=1 Tax=Schizothecium vesticola TaxID=314040 RepID=A0AA40ERL1_9PEZI|nr:hypothetical protein B0T18DRAFT_392773 [Schizothecium vesticola]